MINKILILFLMLTGFLHLSIYFDFQPDDTFIYLVYIKNFVNGNGLTFNGEYVEGFSSVLWVYLNILFAWLPFELLYVAKLIGGIFYFLTAFLMFKILIKITENKISKINILLVTSIYFFYPPLAIWSMAGLETMLYSFWLLFCIYYYFSIRIINEAVDKKKFILVGILFGILATIRPEAFALIGIPVLFEIYLLFKVKKLKYPHYAYFLIGYLLILFSLLTWRYASYGEFLPITALAKTGNLHNQINAGINYTKVFLQDWWPIIALYIYATASLFFEKNVLVRKWNIISIIAVSGYTLFIIASGADWMLSYRFFIPIIPIIFIVIGLSILKSRFIILTVIILISFFSYKNYYLYPVIKQQVLSDAGDIKLGLYLKSLNLPKNEIISVFDAGAIPYYSGMKTIDMIGLNNKHIAHKKGGFFEKYDNEYILQNNPIYVQLRTNLVKDQYAPELFFIGTSKLFYNNEFQKNYEFDKNAPISHFYKRRATSLEKTFLDSYYEYIVSDFICTSRTMSFLIGKTGDGVWLKPPYQYAIGSIYISAKILDMQNNIIFESLVPLSKDMVKNDKTPIYYDIPVLEFKKYTVEVKLIHMGIKDSEEKYINEIQL